MSKTMENFNGHNLYTAPDGKWRVAVLLKNNQTAITDPNKYASQASATLAAIAAKREKPFMDFVAVRS